MVGFGFGDAVAGGVAAGGGPTVPGGSFGVVIGGSGRGVPSGAGESSTGAPPAYSADSATTSATYESDRL